jgi:ubiquitin-conjugating enzyme E2 variant
VTRRRRLELLEGSAVAACAVLAAPIVVRLVIAPTDVMRLSLCVLGGYLAADLASGLVHWFCDRFFDEYTQLVGPILIRPFREHHRDPLEMTRHGFLELTGNSCLGLAPALALGWWCAGGPSVDALVLSFSGGVVLTNVLHKWAHAATAPVVVRWLQRVRLVLAPAAHARHHRAGHAGGYCVTSGWLNPLTDRLRLFDGLELTVAALGVPRTTARD